MIAAYLFLNLRFRCLWATPADCVMSVNQTSGSSLLAAAPRTAQTIAASAIIPLYRSQGVPLDWVFLNTLPPPSSRPQFRASRGDLRRLPVFESAVNHLRDSHRRNNHHGYAPARLRPVPRKVEVSQRSANSRTPLTELLGRHLPAQHGALVIERVSPRRKRRSAHADDDLFGESGHDALEIREYLSLHFGFMRLTVGYVVVVYVGKLLNHDDVPSRRRHIRLEQSGHEYFESSGHDGIGIPLIGVIALGIP